MKHLVGFRVFESSGSGLTPEQEEFLNGCTKGTWTLNRTTGLVDVDGDFDCSKEKLEDLKGVRFGTVKGDFDCSGNLLTTLKGAPASVGGDFSCGVNKLTTLEGAPASVRGDFSCSVNKLTTLEGAPSSVEGDFSCGRNKLTTLEGAPKTVGGGFGCSHNKLTSLEGAPESVGGYFFCYDNKLTTLEGAPQKVERDFDCEHNPLTSLKGAPEKIGGKFHSDSVKLPPGAWSLKGILDAYRGSSGEKKALLGTLVSPESLQKRVDQNPEKAAIELKGMLKDPMLSGLKWPESLKREVGLLGDLDDVGF